MSAQVRPKGIVGYVAHADTKGQRERIESVLAEAGLSAVEIVEEVTCPTLGGRNGFATVLDYARRSDIDTLVVASFNALFQDPRLVDHWRRELAVKYGVRVVEA